MALECCRQTRGLGHHATTWVPLYNSIDHTHTHTHTGGRAVRTTSPKASNDLHPPGPPCPNGTGGPIGTVPLPETNLSCSRAPSQTPPSPTPQNPDTNRWRGRDASQKFRRRPEGLLACWRAHEGDAHPATPQTQLAAEQESPDLPKPPPRTRPQPDPAPPAPRAPAGERGPSGPNWRPTWPRPPPRPVAVRATWPAWWTLKRSRPPHGGMHGRPPGLFRGGTPPWVSAPADRLAVRWCMPRELNLCRPCALDGTSLRAWDGQCGVTVSVGLPG